MPTPGRLIVDVGFLVEALLAGAEEDDADDSLTATISVFVPANTALQREAAAAADAMGASLLSKTQDRHKKKLGLFGGIKRSC